MEPIQNPPADTTAASTPVLKSCSHCGGQAKVTTTAKPLRYGVICLDCPVEIRPVLLTQELAIRHWNSRRGTSAYFGGKATRSISTRKKRRSCRRNLRIAREQKKLKWIRRRVDVIASRLKAFREIEQAELEAEVARDRAELAILEPLIRQYPDLSELLDWLKHQWERAEGGDQHRNDSPQPEPANSVLLEQHNEHEQS